MGKPDHRFSTSESIAREIEFHPRAVRPEGCGDKAGFDAHYSPYECFKWRVSYVSLRPTKEDLAYLYEALAPLRLISQILPFGKICRIAQ